MTFQEVMGYLSGVFVMTGMLLYIIGMVRGAESKKSTWFIWAVLDNALFVSMYLADKWNYQIMTTAVGIWFVFGFSLKYGDPEWDATDLWCLAGAAVGIVLIFTSAPLISMLALSTVILLGSIPTIKKSWHHPEHEDFAAWHVFFASCVASILAVTEWTLAEATQPVIFLAVSTAILGVLYIRRGRTVPNRVPMREVS